MARELPQWQVCPPPSPGLYFTFSDLDQRDDAPGLAQWDG
jgi:hypothetical protein